MLSSFEYCLLSSKFKLGKGNKLFQEQERLVIKHAFFSSASQRQIIDKTRIPQQTVSRIVKSLLEKEVLTQETKLSTGGRGQPGYFLEPNASYAYGLGIAILSDSVSIALMNFQGEVIYSKQRVLTNMSIKNVLVHLRELFDLAIADTKISQDNILGIGIGISGYFIDTKNKINTHSTLSEWADVDIAGVISDEFPYPVWVENDATAAAAGEGVVGVGKKVSNFVYLFISTGFGGGIIINDDIMRGTHGNAGEVGDMIPPKLYIHPNLENLRLTLIKNGVNIETINDLLEDFDINWPGIKEWIYKVKDAVSLVASSSAALLDTEAIVIGGHIPKELAQQLLHDVEIYAQHRRSSSRPLPDLLISGVDYESVAVGAATIPFRALCL